MRPSYGCLVGAAPVQHWKQSTATPWDSTAPREPFPALDVKEARVQFPSRRAASGGRFRSTDQFVWTGKPGGSSLGGARASRPSHP
jgi:hypothetical protein